MKSYSTVVRQKIQLHILDFYDERGKRGLYEDYNAVKYDSRTREQAAKHLVEGGNFLISYFDQRKFVDSLKINDTHKEYDDQQVFDKYVSLLAREILALIAPYESVK